MTHTYSISGMTCQGCVGRVKSELLKLGEITSTEVQLESPQAVITMNKHIGTNILQAAVSRAGHYTITELGHAMPSDQKMDEDSEEKNSYYPIFLIFGYITGITLLIQFVNGGFDAEQWMRHFMAGFFLVFSFFKLLNIKGFAEGYQTYDIVARQVPAWGFVYPFIELGLGILFLTGLYPVGTGVATLIVMSVSSVGVIKSLLKKTPFQCACLGTIIKLPLSKVTLFEDLLMIVMSAAMLTIF